MQDDMDGSEPNYTLDAVVKAIENKHNIANFEELANQIRLKRQLLEYKEEDERHQNYFKTRQYYQFLHQNELETNAHQVSKNRADLKVTQAQAEFARDNLKIERDTKQTKLDLLRQNEAEQERQFDLNQAKKLITQELVKINVKSATQALAGRTQREMEDLMDTVDQYKGWFEHDYNRQYNEFENTRRALERDYTLRADAVRDTYRARFDSL